MVYKFKITARLVVILLTVLLFSSNIVFAANNYSSIDYVIAQLDLNKIPAIKIKATIKGDLSESLVMDMPHNWAGVDYTKQIKNIKILHPRGCKFSINKKDGYQLKIQLPKIQTDSVELSYEVHQKPNNPSNVHETIVRQDLIHSTGYGIFAVPADVDEKHKLKINIEWQNIPRTWNSLSSWGREKNLHFTANIFQLLHSVYVAGNVRIYQIMNGKNPVFLSLYGKFDIQDEQMRCSLRNIISTQRAFFKDYDFPYYAISIIQGDEPNSWGGTGLHNSFTAFIPENSTKLDYYILFAHEHLHSWIGASDRIKIMGEQERLSYWWSEGFTDYYTRILALRSKAISLEEFITECNQFLRNYYLSPAINEPNSRIVKDFWNDYEVEKLPYYRGFVFAMYLNGLIKQNKGNKSLDNVIMDLLKDAKHYGFSTERFKTIVKKYVPQGIDTELSRFIDNGETIDLDNILDDLPLEKTQMGTYELGFDSEYLIKQNTIKNIKPDSNAYKSGLRNGYKIIEWSVPKGRGDPEQIVTFATDNKIFKFRPESADKKLLYQFKTNLSAKERAKIKRFFIASFSWL